MTCCHCIAALLMHPKGLDAHMPVTLHRLGQSVLHLANLHNEYGNGTSAAVGGDIQLCLWF